MDLYKIEVRAVAREGEETVLAEAYMHGGTLTRGEVGKIIGDCASEAASRMASGGLAPKRWS